MGERVEMKKSTSYIAVPPGATIKEQLVINNMSQKEFSARMSLSEKHVSHLINGDVGLTTDVAFRLETVLGIPAKYWLRLEALYREDLQKVEWENSLENDAILAKQFPYNDMSNYGWVPKARTAKDKAKALRQFFGVVNLPSICDERVMPRVACRRLAVTNKSDLALLAWIQAAKYAAKDCNVPELDIKKLNDALPTIRKMSLTGPDYFCNELKKELSDVGIALVFLPHLKGSYLHGATFNDGGKVVLGLTARGKDADKFWFSLFHELAHIYLGHISNKKYITDEQEDEANKWARNMLIPFKDYNKYLEQDYITRDSIITFSIKENIAPGIVVGRLQNDKIIDYDMYNDLKEKYCITV